MSRKIILIKQELLLLVYELNRSGLLAENEKIRPILAQLEDRKSGSAGMPRPISYAVFCLKKKKERVRRAPVDRQRGTQRGGLELGAEPDPVPLGDPLVGTALVCFFFNDTATTEIYTLSLHDALPICRNYYCLFTN